MRSLGISVFLASVLFACGNEQQQPAYYGPQPGFGGNQICGPVVSNDYNSAVSACQGGANGFQPSPQGISCLGAVQNFLQKYPNVNCEAGEMGTNRPFRITSERVRAMVQSNVSSVPVPLERF